MPEMPSLGEEPKQTTPVVPVAIAAVVVGLLTGGIYWVRNLPNEVQPEEAKPAVAAPQAAPSTPLGMNPAPLGMNPAPLGMNAAAVPSPAAAPVAAPAPVVIAPDKSALHSFQVKISGPLESAIVASEGKAVGTPLTQVVNRSLVWWVRVPQDLVKGDTLAVVYETREGQEPLVHAVRFESQKQGRTFEAYRYKPSGEGFARYYQADASELEERLVASPLESYEQITSLLRDGRKHKGVDFKTPVGTAVHATFDGTVTRKNWNFRGNGNSVELQESGGQGRTALFLHLSEVPKSLIGGERVKKGEVIGKSGNTGHSFAPHLHYQLMSGGTVIDPFTSQKTTRVSLPEGERTGFEKRVTELKALIPAVAAVGG